MFAPLHHIYEHRDLFIELLQSLGWTINFEKSDLVPSLSKTFIGYVIDNSGSRTVIKVTSDRIRKVRKDINRVLKKQSVTARGLARIAGQCVSMSKCVLPAKLLLRNMYRLLKSRLCWSDVLLLDTCTNNDLKWWYESLTQWNGVIVENKPIDCQLVTDASSIAWGAWTDSLKAQGFWIHRVAYASSNYRELLAVYMGLMSFRKMFANKHVQILSDNYCGSFCEQIRRRFERVRLPSAGYSSYGYGQQNNITSSLFIRHGKLEGRPIVKNEFNVRVDASSKSISLLRSGMGTSSGRPLRIFHDNPAPRIQFHVLGSSHSRSERASPNRLGFKEQLYESTF